MVPTAARMTIEWFVPAAQTRPITMALHSLMDDTRIARGCVGCSVSTGLAEQGTVRYVEEWETEDDLRRRLRCRSFTQLVALMDDAIKPPLVEFALPHGRRGLDFAEEVRRSKSSNNSEA